MYPYNLGSHGINGRAQKLLIIKQLKASTLYSRYGKDLCVRVYVCSGVGYYAINITK